MPYWYIWLPVIFLTLGLLYLLAWADYEIERNYDRRIREREREKKGGGE